MNNILKKSYIGDICDINLSTYSPSENWKFVNYLDTGNITKNKIENIQYIDLNIDKLPSRARRKVKLNNIIYSTVRPNQMHYGILTQDIPENFLVSTGFAVLDVDTTQADPYFVYYSLIRNDNTTALQAIAEQSTSAYPSIKPSNIKNREILLPPLETQQKIASILSSIDDKIELNNSINNNLEQQAQAIFKSWFVDFEPFGNTMPFEWNIGKLEEIVEFSNGYAFKSSELLSCPDVDCYNVFKQGHINRGGGFNPLGTKSWYPKDKAKNLGKYILKKGDILMAMTDMKDNVAILGNTALMGVDDQYIVNQRVGLLRAKNDYNISYPFIYILTNSTDFLADLRKRANSGVQVNLSSTEIKNSDVIIATKDINSKFDNIVKPFFEQIFINNIENSRLIQLRDTLLPKLMSGEIDVSEVDISTDKLYEPTNESKLSAEPYNPSGSFASVSKNLPSEQSSSADKLL